MNETRATDDPTPRGGPWTWGLPAVAAALALVVALAGLDRELFAVVNGWARGSPALSALWGHVTTLGTTEVALALALPALLRLHPALLLAAGLTAVLAAVASSGLKAATDVDRPARVLSAEEVHVVGDVRRKRSFPSGHTNTAFATAGLLALASRRRSVRLALVAAAGAVGVSRVVVGAHWPTDVLAGAALGWTCATAGWALALRWQPRAGPRVRGVLLGLVTLGVVSVLRKAPDADAPAVHWVAAACGLLAVVPAWWRGRGGTPA